MSDLAWHFLRVDEYGTLRLRDGREAVPGEWLEHEGPIVLCDSGLHASRRALDALTYCTWERAAACLVEVEGVEAEDANKLACRRRRIVAVVRDASAVPQSFARECALSVIHLWDAPAIVRQYLETGDEEIRDAARDAAWAAAWAAARASWAAAEDAARAAWAAAGAAAWAAWAAAEDAAWAAAEDAARDAARDAAWAAAWDAAWAAARDAARDLLESMLLADAEWVQP